MNVEFTKDYFEITIGKTMLHLWWGIDRWDKVRCIQFAGFVFKKKIMWTLKLWSVK
jgi:hypothetical protein